MFELSESKNSMSFLPVPDMLLRAIVIPFLEVNHFELLQMALTFSDPETRYASFEKNRRRTMVEAPKRFLVVSPRQSHFEDHKARNE